MVSYRIALIAGETSGDHLGAGLIAALKYQYPDAQFFGVGGPMMQASGLVSWEPMERLAVMGLTEVLGRLPELLLMRRRLLRRFLAQPPDVFIGIDSPDFNLPIAMQLRAAGIKTAHYVSPSVWAWRPKRAYKIARAVDLMLALFPFEEQFYRMHQVPVVCVGHPLADKLPLTPTPLAQAKSERGLTGPVIALVPGSRMGEIKRMAPLFFETAQKLQAQLPGLTCLIPAASQKILLELQALSRSFPELRVRIEVNAMHAMIAAADVVLITSGTATLETLLLKKPMVVSYKVSILTACILKRLLLQPYISLPNLLAQKKLVPEILQKAAVAERLVRYVLQTLQEAQHAMQWLEDYTTIHRQLKRGADQRAAEAIAFMLGS